MKLKFVSSRAATVLPAASWLFGASQYSTEVALNASNFEARSGPRRQVPAVLCPKPRSCLTVGHKEISKTSGSGREYLNRNIPCEKSDFFLGRCSGCLTRLETFFTWATGPGNRSCNGKKKLWLCVNKICTTEFIEKHQPPGRSMPWRAACTVRRRFNTWSLRMSTYHSRVQPRLQKNSVFPFAAPPVFNFQNSSAVTEHAESPLFG